MSGMEASSISSEKAAVNPEPQPVLQKYADEFSGELYELDQNLSELIKLIEPVLSQEIPNITGSDAEAMPPVSDLSKFFIQKTEMLKELNRTLYAVRRRVEC